MVSESAGTLEFDYRPSRLKTVGLGTLALSGLVLLIYLARTVNGPVDVKGIRLTPAAARTLFAVAACVSSLGVVTLLAMIYVAFAWDRRVAITSTALILPQPHWTGLSREELHIPLTTIHSLQLVPFIGRTRLLRIHYSDTTIHIPSNMFASERVFDELCETLSATMQKFVGE